MFSKAKRFPEGSKSKKTALNFHLTEHVLLPPPAYFSTSSAGKDYIPGPGEYDLAVDEMGRHKRYGFLTQTNRFHEGSLGELIMCIRMFEECLFY